MKGTRKSTTDSMAFETEDVLSSATPEASHLNDFRHANGACILEALLIDKELYLASEYMSEELNEVLDKAASCKAPAGREPCEELLVASTAGHRLYTVPCTTSCTATSSHEL